MAHCESEFTFTWKIENFSMAPHQTCEKIVSPTFVAETLAKSTWRLILYPKGDSSSQAIGDHYSVYLNRVNFDENAVASKICFTLALESANSAMLKKTNIIVCGSTGTIHRFSICQLSDLIFKRRYLAQDILTIKCHMWPYEGICKEPTVNIKQNMASNNLQNQCSARTRIEFQKRTLIWSIKKINKLKESHEKVSINVVNNLEDSPALKLSFYISKLRPDYAQIEILQTRFSRNRQRLFVNCKITVVSADKDHQEYKEDSHLFNLSLNEIWSFPEFFETEYLTGDRYVYVDDTIFLKIDLSFTYKDSEYHSELSTYMPSTFHTKAASKLTQLSSNIQHLLEQRKFCDVEIRDGGGKTFPSHKLVLCAQSPVFSAMFENDLKEKKTGVVEITDFKYQTIEQMLAFMYSGVLNKNLPTEEIIELYSAADKYEIVHLQRHCAILLASTLSVGNICDVLVLADRHLQDNFLWTHINNFLCIHSREIFHSPEWNKFMFFYPELWRKLMVNICMK